MKITIDLHEQADEYIDELLKTGLFGVNASDVATRLVERQLHQELVAGFIKRGSPPETMPIHLGCAVCGSPRIADGGTMGSGPECQDCGAPATFSVINR